MPIPLLFIGIGAGLGALGVGKGVKAGVEKLELINFLKCGILNNI